MNLPPKIIRQQIARKDPRTAKVPLSAARPVTMEDLQSSAPAINPKPNPSIITQIKEPFPQADENLVKADSSAVQKSVDSLPILSAFQEFLDNERERTKKKILIMSFSYLVALILIVSISLTAGTMMIKRLRVDFQNIRTEVSKIQSLSLKAKTDAETLSQRLSRETIRMRTEQDSSTDEVKERLGKMDLVVQSLQKENTVLKDNLTSMKAHWMNITNDLVASLSLNSNLGPRVQKAGSNYQINSSSCIALSITPKGIDHAVEWRIPIPE